MEVEYETKLKKLKKIISYKDKKGLLLYPKRPVWAVPVWAVDVCPIMLKRNSPQYQRPSALEAPYLYFACAWIL